MSTRRERLTRKLERRGDWAASARQKSDQAFEVAAERASVIPMGQPILIGHHSERRDRRYRAGIAAKMDRGVAELRKAEYHEAKARGLEMALESSIYSDDPDVLDKLRAKVAELEAARQTMKAANAAFKKSGAAGLVEILGQTRAVEVMHRASLTGSGRPFPAYAFTNTSSEIRRCKQRIESIEAQRKRAGEAVAAGGVRVARRPEHGWCVVTFAEKPDRSVLNALRAAGYSWSQGSWRGHLSKLPPEVEAAEAEAKAGQCSDRDGCECQQCELDRLFGEKEMAAGLVS